MCDVYIYYAKGGLTRFLDGYSSVYAEKVNIFCHECVFSAILNRSVKGGLKSEISLLHVKVLTLIKAKTNAFI